LVRVRRPRLAPRLGIIAGFRLGRRHVANGFEQAAIVEPLDPLQRGELDGFEGSPRTPTMDTSALNRPLMVSARALRLR
jgi:hypothetical protein